MLLAGDIGGTKTHLAVFSEESGPHQPVNQATFQSMGYPGLEQLVEDYLAGHDFPVESACFGVAGPVVNQESAITNLPWIVSANNIKKLFGFSRVSLLNDLVSMASAIPILEPDDVHVLNQARTEPEGAIALIAPGTGLGEAYLTWNGVNYIAHPSEGGHADFAPTSEIELELLDYLKDIEKHVSYERVCSGKGIPNIYNFLRDTGRAQEPAWLAEKIRLVDDPTPVIVRSASGEETPCEICRQTLGIFISIFGSETGNLALKVLSTGGVFLGGGIPRRIIPFLEDRHFMNEFLNKGRLSHILEQMQVCVIINPYTALIGAAQYGMNIN